MIFFLFCYFLNFRLIKQHIIAHERGHERKNGENPIPLLVVHILFLFHYVMYCFPTQVPSIKKVH